METNISQKEKAKLFLNAIDTHRKYTVDVINCESFDRHLLGLRLTSIENKMELPDLFTDNSFKKLNYFFISSSQVSSKFEAVTSYGPFVEDGYGACYNILENKILFGLTSFNSCSKTNTKAFANNIKQSFVDCRNLLIKINSKL